MGLLLEPGPPKVCKTMAFWAIVGGFGLSFYTVAVQEASLKDELRSHKRVLQGGKSIQTRKLEQHPHHNLAPLIRQIMLLADPAGICLDFL